MEDKILTHIISVSGISAEELESRRQLVKTFLQECERNGEELANVAYSINTSGENYHPHRLAVVGKTYEEMLQELDRAESSQIKASPPNLCFLYSGHGSQYLKMGDTLFKTSPTFRYFVEAAEDDWAKLSKENFQDLGDSTYFETLIADEEKLMDPQCGLNAITEIAYALQKLWEYWGILPNSVLGSSVGELPAAAGAGIFRFEAMHWAGQAFHIASNSDNGGMFALFLSETQVNTLLTDFANTCPSDPEIWAEIAVVNSPTQTVVSMSEKAIPFFCAFCVSKAIKYVELPIPRPFHSRGMDPILVKAGETIEGIPMYRQRCTFISSIQGKRLDQSDTNLDYFGRLLRERVHFDKACHAAYQKEGARVFLEIGAHPVQCPLMEANVVSLPEYQNDPIYCLPSLQRGRDDWTTLMTAFAKLYLLGHSVNFSAVYAPYKYLRKIVTPLIRASEVVGPSDIWIKNNNNILLDKKVVYEKVLDLLKIMIAKSGKLNLQGGHEGKHFTELGLSSVQLIYLKSQIQDLFKIQLRFSDLIEFPTLNDFVKLVCRAIENKAKGVKLSESIEETEHTKKILHADFYSLPAHIKRPDCSDKKARPVRLKKIRTLLVTGATGSLGPFFIEWLCKRKQTEKIYCLVRGDKGLDRLVKRFEELELKVDMSKLQVLNGSVCEKQFGLGELEYLELSWEVDAIINSAACTNHLAKYTVEDIRANGPRAVNVIGTIRVLEFACCKRIKWLFQASTGMALAATKYIPYERFPEEWPTEDCLEQIDLVPMMGYPMSKLIGDHLVYEATRRGIPAKVFRFPKIGQCKDASTNHFLCKFVHFFMSGMIPAFDISLQLIPGVDAANVSLRTFFNKYAPASEVYMVMSPHNVSELDMAELGNELGPSLRFMIDAVRMNTTEFGEDDAETHKRKKKLAPVLEMLDQKYGKPWIDNPVEALQDDLVREFMKEQYEKKMQYVDYVTFLDKAERDGLRTPLFPWIEFYADQKSAYKRFYEKELPDSVPLHVSESLDLSGEYMRFGKLERLYREEIFEMISDPLSVVRADIMYCIMSANKLFSKLL